METTGAVKLPVLSTTQFDEASALLNAALDSYYGLHALVSVGRLGSGLLPDVMRVRIRLLSQDLAKLADELGLHALSPSLKIDTKS